MDLVVLGYWLDSMILRVFSNQNDSMILFWSPCCQFVAEKSKRS